MELKYTYVIYIGIAVITMFIIGFVIKKNKKGYFSGKKIAKMEQLSKNKYFARKKRFYRFYSVAWFVLAMIGVLVAFILIARPYKTEMVDEEKYQRDIIICLDISTSVDEVNMKLINELQTTVTQLQGERIGIVIFNTSPLLLVPLTDDYEFVNDQLAIIKEGLRRRLSENYTNIEEDFYYEDYITQGTLVGNEERGSSLISDGLASCVYDFSDKEQERTRVVIFATDNDVQGECILTLDEASELCKENKITVYGVGTDIMEESDISELKRAVENTGGKFYREGTSGSFQDIVNEIQKKSQSLVKGDRQVIEKDYPQTIFKILLSCIMGLFLVTRLMKL